MEGFWERFGAVFAAVGSLIISPGVWKTIGIAVAFCVVEFAIGWVFLRAFIWIREGCRRLWQNILLYVGWGILMAVWTVATGAAVYGLGGDSESAVIIAFVMLLVHWIVYFIGKSDGRWW